MFDIDIHDQCGAQPPETALVLSWSQGMPMTAKTLISERVRLEYERAEDGDPRRNLVQLTVASRLSPEGAIELALKGFLANRFFLIVDGKQITELETPFTLQAASSVVFLRLISLKGG
jgi:hypothetical protein